MPAEAIRQAARLYATASAAAMYWGMGISQSTHGTDNTLTLTNLALMCGHVGRPGTGLNPLRGRTTSRAVRMPAVCRASTRPTSRSPTTDSPQVRGGMARAIVRQARPDCYRDGGRHPDRPGQRLVRDGREPDDERDPPAPRPACDRTARVFVAQDIFFNETNVYADVILPAASFAEKDGTFTNSDRRVQRCRAAVPAPGWLTGSGDYQRSGAAHCRTNCQLMSERRPGGQIAAICPIRPGRDQQIGLFPPLRDLGGDAAGDAGFLGDHL